MAVIGMIRDGVNMKKKIEMTTIQKIIHNTFCFI